jgi:hypothetical protein
LVAVGWCGKKLLDFAKILGGKKPVSYQEVTGAVINSEYVTNDIGMINVARLSDQTVKYVSRDYARRMSSRGQGPEWRSLADGPAVAVIVDGVSYGRTTVPSSTPFRLSVKGVSGHGAFAR